MIAQQLRGYFSQILKPINPLWHFARFLYLVVSGVAFSDLYHYLRLKRNAQGLRQHGAEILKHVTGFCEELGVRPMLNCGSLLAHVKNGHFEPSSKDMDLAVFSDELSNPSRLVDRMKSIGLRLRVNGKLSGPLEKIGPYYLLQFHHPQKHVSVDICFIHRYEGKVVFLENRSVDYLYRKYLGDKKASFEPYLGYYRGFSPDVYAGLKPVTFEGSRVWIPGNPWALLEYTYGPEIAAGKKNIFYHVCLIRQDANKGVFEIVDPSHGKIS